MKVKFYQGGRKYAVIVPEGAYNMIISEMQFQLGLIGHGMTDISNITVHHDDGCVEEGVPTYAPNGELVTVGRRIFTLG